MSIRSVAREIAYNIGKVAYRTETTRSIFKCGAKFCRQVGPLILSDYQTGEVMLRLEMARHSTIPPQLPVHRYEAPDLDLPPVVINLKDDRVESTSALPTPETLKMEVVLERIKQDQRKYHVPAQPDNVENEADRPFKDYLKKKPK